MKLCSACNKELADNAKFCPGCGSKQEAVSSSAPSDSPPSEPGLGFLSPKYLFSVAAIGIGVLFYYYLAAGIQVNYATLTGKSAFTIFQTKELSSKLSSIGANADVSYFFGVAGPSDALKKDGIFLVGSGCMPKDCGNSQGLIFVNTQTNDVVVITVTEDPNSWTMYGINYNEKNYSFNKPIPPLAARWLRSKRIRVN